MNTDAYIAALLGFIIRWIIWLRSLFPVIRRGAIAVHFTTALLEKWSLLMSISISEGSSIEKYKRFLL